MNNYTIHCTPEQTKNAIELGAPIEIKYGSINHIPSNEELKYLLSYSDMWYKIPTAEQMINWLESELGEIMVTKGFDHWIYKIIDNDTLIEEPMQFISRKEATLKAINIALNYLYGKKNALLKIN